MIRAWPWLICGALLLAQAVQAGPQLSSPIAVPHWPTQPDLYVQTAAIVAAGPNGYLVVWSTRRDSSTPIWMGARLDASGRLLDPYGFELWAGASVIDLRVVWDGQRYVASWIEISARLKVVTVTEAGTVSPVLTWETTGGNIRSYAVATDGASRCLFAWWRYNVTAGHFVELAVLKDGAFEQINIPLTSVIADQHEPTVAFDGTGYLVAWRDIRRPDAGDIYVARVTATGTVIDTEGIPVSMTADEEGTPQLSWNGTHHLLIWTRDPRGARQVRAVRLSAAGARLDAEDLVLSGAPSDVTLKWNGTDHLLLWQSSGVQALPVSPGGSVGAARTLVTRTNVSPLALGFQGPFLPTPFLATWSEALYSDPDVYVGSVDSSGAITPAAGRLVTMLPSNESEPALASDGTNHFLVWTDLRHGPPNIYGTRVSAAGAVLDGEGFLISRAPLGDSSTHASVAWGDGRYLVVWQRQRKGTLALELDAARVGPDGVVLDAEPIVVTPAGRDGDVVWNGTDFVVVWSKVRTIEVGRVTPGGQLRDAAPRLLSTRDGGSPREPSVAFSGSTILVAWEDNSQSRPYVRRLGLDGTPIDCEEVPLALRGWSMSVAGGNAGFMVAASTNIYDITRDHIVVSRLDPEGRLLDTSPLRVTTDNTLNNRPVISWDGAGYVVTWLRTTLGTTSELDAVRVSTEGNVMDAAPVVLAQSPGGDGGYFSSPIVDASGPGRSLIVYRHRAPSVWMNPRYEEAHLWMRTWTTLAPGAPCAAGSDCASGICSQVCLAPPVPQATTWIPPCAPDGGGGGGDGGGGGGGGDGGQTGMSDAGGDPPPPRTGCGCSGAEGVGMLGALLVLALRVPGRRRRHP